MSIWTNENKKELLNLYIEGHSLKIMSRMIGRSTTAINKALQRFKIRELAKEHQKQRLACILLKKPTINTFEQMVHAYKKQTKSYRRHWIDMEQALFLLIRKGHIVEKRTKELLSESHQLHIDGKPFSPEQISVLLNQYREREQMAPLYIKGVSL